MLRSFLNGKALNLMMRSQHQGPNKIVRKHPKAPVFTAAMSSPAGPDPGHDDGGGVLATEKVGFGQYRSNAPCCTPEFLNFIVEGQHPFPDRRLAQSAHGSRALTGLHQEDPLGFVAPWKADNGHSFVSLRCT